MRWPLSILLSEPAWPRSAGAASPEAVESARVEFLGQKQGRLKAAQERLKSLEPASRREYGQKFNARRLPSRRPARRPGLRLEHPRAVKSTTRSTSRCRVFVPGSGTAIP